MNRAAVRIHQIVFEDRHADDLALNYKDVWLWSLDFTAVFLIDGITNRWREISRKIFSSKCVPSGVHDII